MSSGFHCALADSVSHKLPGNCGVNAHDDHNVCITVFRDGLVMCSGRTCSGSSAQFARAAPYAWAKGDDARVVSTRSADRPAFSEGMPDPWHVVDGLEPTNRPAYGRKDCVAGAAPGSGEN